MNERYPLAVTHLSNPCKAIARHRLLAFRYVKYGGKSLGGAGFTKLYQSQDSCSAAGFFTSRRPVTYIKYIKDIHFDMIAYFDSLYLQLRVIPCTCIDC